jgi:putative ABC transport system substrate-binding protein
MIKQVFVWLLATVFLTTVFPVQAQQPKKVPRIGYLTTGTTQSARREAFRHGLRDLSYVEGQNTVIEYRYAEGNVERLPILRPSSSGSRLMSSS